MDCSAPKFTVLFNILINKKLNTVEKDLYEVELLKSTIEHSEHIIVGFFIMQYAKLRMLELYYNMQYAKLRMLELYYNFFDELCDVNKFEELEMNTVSLFLAPAGENLYDCIEPDKRAAWEKMREKLLQRLFQGGCKNEFIPSNVLQYA